VEGFEEFEEVGKKLHLPSHCTSLIFNQFICNPLPSVVTIYTEIVGMDYILAVFSYLYLR